MPVHKEEYKGLTIKVYHDEDPAGPREWDNFGHMVCFHRDYKLGDDHDFTPEILAEFVKREDVFSLPLRLYDHSGISISTGNAYPFNDRWDSMQVGYIYCTKEDIRENWGVKHVTKKKIEHAYRLMEGEVKTYNQYLTGDVYGYVVEDKEGDNLDSCWGFYGFDYCLKEAKSVADYQAEVVAKEHRQRVEKIVQKAFRRECERYIWENVLTV